MKSSVFAKNRLIQLKKLFDAGELSQSEYDAAYQAISNTLGDDIAINKEKKDDSINEANNESEFQEQSNTKYEYNHKKETEEQSSKAINNSLLGISFAIIVIIAIGFSLERSTNIRIPLDTQYRALERFMPLAKGKGIYKKAGGNVEQYVVSIFQRQNVNNHYVYDVKWSDGYTSSYIFWRSGDVEIFSKNGKGQAIKTMARFKIYGNRNCLIVTNAGAVTLFGQFKPIKNL